MWLESGMSIMGPLVARATSMYNMLTQKFQDSYADHLELAKNRLNKTAWNTTLRSWVVTRWGSKSCLFSSRQAFLHDLWISWIPSVYCNVINLETNGRWQRSKDWFRVGECRNWRTEWENDGISTIFFNDQYSTQTRTFIAGTDGHSVRKEPWKIFTFYFCILGIY